MRIKWIVLAAVLVSIIMTESAMAGDLISVDALRSESGISPNEVSSAELQEFIGHFSITPESIEEVPQEEMRQVILAFMEDGFTNYYEHLLDPIFSYSEEVPFESIKRLALLISDEAATRTLFLDFESGRYYYDASLNFLRDIEKADRKETISAGLKNKVEDILKQIDFAKWNEEYTQSSYSLSDEVLILDCGITRAVYYSTGFGTVPEDYKDTIKALESLFH